METLKIRRRCPFCFAPTEYMKVVVERSFRRKGKNPFDGWVHCSFCESWGPRSCGETDTQTKAEAVRFWNARGNRKSWGG